VSEDPVDMKRWRETPSVSGRAATDADVNAGRAIFAVGGEPVEVAIPSCAIVREDGIGEATDGMVAIGYRMVDGGSGIAPLDDVEFLSEPDGRFK
jgi:hypothetical protein